MFGKGFLIAFLLPVTTLIATAAAQKNELGGGIGHTFIADQGIKPGPVQLQNNSVHFANGTTFEINYTRRLLGEHTIALDLEVPFAGNPDEDLASGNGAIPSTYSSYFVTPSARVKFFADQLFSPWVSLGGGYGRFNFSKTLVYGGSNPGASSKNSGLFQAGLGLDVMIRRRFGLRLTTREFMSAALPLNVNIGKSHQNNILVTGGFIWRF